MSQVLTENKRLQKMVKWLKNAYEIQKVGSWFYHLKLIFCTLSYKTLRLRSSCTYVLISILNSLTLTTLLLLRALKEIFEIVSPQFSLILGIVVFIHINVRYILYMNDLMCIYTYYVYIVNEFIDLRFCLDFYYYSIINRYLKCILNYIILENIFLDIRLIKINNSNKNIL